MAKRPPKKRSKNLGSTPGRTDPLGLRIVGGTFRGRKLDYGGDRRVRPMKDRIREALFNLIGPPIKGKYVVDLFGGTGAIGLEALSRGAVGATFIERHFPTARVLRANAESLGVQDRIEIVTNDTFFWLRNPTELSEEPWCVFVSPPYSFYIDRADDMLNLIGTLIDRAPAGSIFAVESDDQFDFATLPEAEAWDVRPYYPAVVGVYRKGEDREIEDRE
ncbi:MAG: RsmD family RNA methyltransferase [Planctomycetia bacterium]